MLLPLRTCGEFVKGKTNRNEAYPGHWRMPAWDPGADNFGTEFQRVIECSLNSTTT